MILGIDHLALSVASLTPISENLQEQGWRLRFHVSGLPNRGQKHPLLSCPAQHHDIAWLAPPGTGLALELTAHGPPDTRWHAPYQPVLPAAAGRTTERQATNHEQRVQYALQAIGHEEARPVHWQDVDSPAWQTGQSKRPLVILCTGDVATECDFWRQHLGWRLRRQEKNWAWLEVVSPLAQWCCELLLVQGETRPEYPLDSAGFPCLAMFSNHLEDDLQRAGAGGARWLSDPFTLEVNRRPLRIGLLRTPGGAICELLQPEK